QQKYRAPDGEHLAAPLSALFQPTGARESHHPGDPVKEYEFAVEEPTPLIEDRTEGDYDGGRNPCATAQAAICARELKPSLFKICCTCVSAVLSAIDNVAAISRLVFPSTIRVTTSRSRNASRPARLPTEGLAGCSSLRRRASVGPKAYSMACS